MDAITQGVWQGLQISGISELIDKGGDVLWVIFAAALLLWTLIIERILFFQFTLPNALKRSKAQLTNNSYNPWQLKHVVNLVVSQQVVQIDKNLFLIKTLIAICPLLGLLGTVSGMMHIFDVLAVTGTGNPKAMAAGISQATIPTMAGMVVALSGLYFGAFIDRRAGRFKHKVRELMSDALTEGKGV